MMIISLGTAVFLGFNYAQRDALQLRSGARQIFAFLNHARSVALLEGTPNHCLFSTQNSSWAQSAREKTLSLPDHVSISFDSKNKASDKSRSESKLVVTFFPDGTATQSRISLQAGDHAVNIEISPLLGQVVLHPMESLDE